MKRWVWGAALLTAACGGRAVVEAPGPWMPSEEELAAPAPDSFVVAFETSEGPFQATFLREWSPLGVDRAYHLFKNDFYAGARFYRMEDGFVAQWGFSGRTAEDSLWVERNIDDEPVVGSNVRGTISFARAGARTRSIQMFINLSDNERLDQANVGGVRGYPPLGRIDSGVEVVDGFYGAYRPSPPRQDSLARFGNDYLRRHFPQLDSIVGTRIVQEWPPAVEGN